MYLSASTVTLMPYLCHWFVFVCYSNVTRMCLYVTPIPLVSVRTSLAYHFTYFYAIRMSFVMYSYVFVCYLYVLVCHTYVLLQ